VLVLRRSLAQIVREHPSGNSLIMVLRSWTSEGCPVQAPLRSPGVLGGYKSEKHLDSLSQLD
jgi:hypothetical protein